MSQTYSQLVKTGCVGRIKRDVLLEAAYDLEYIGGIINHFEDAGNEARADATNCAIALISELVDKGLCFLATWSVGYGSKPLIIRKTQVELESLLIESKDGDHCFDCFVIATSLGKEWVERYNVLVSEL
jgi:hypothetical protein